MSSRPPQSVGIRARPSGRSPIDGHTPAEGWTPVAYNHSARRSGSTPPGRPGSVERRRAAARARRRRLLAIDLALGFTLALAVIVIASGLAIVAVLALTGLLACAVSLAYGRVRRRRAAHRS